MKAIYYILFVCLFCSCGNSKKATSPNTKMTQEERLIGNWEFFLIVCNKRVAERAVFTLNITQESITLEGNKVECNSCFASYSLQENQIIFDKSGMACTELECEHRSTFCEKEETLTFLFSNMEFEILGDELTLTKGEKSIVLTRAVE